jgi:conjugal transfer pilus assembly protein TraV
MKAKELCGFLLIAFVLTGCSTMSEVFNPYDEEFMCPDVGYGKCATMDEAYKESYEAHAENEMVLTEQGAESINGKCQSGKCKNEEAEEGEEAPVKMGPDPEYNYRNRLFQEMASVIEDTETPLLAPPKIGRVLVLNYSDTEDVFYSSRHIYFITKNPQWVLAPYEGLE